MIINEQSSAFNKTSLPTETFSVEESPLLFWVMSNALYSYKERAVLRELAANAWDAHAEAGCKETPVRIKLPTKMEPELVIQDFGTGMSREDLRNYYFAYFKSTKRDSNDKIGGFGVGCKTPFIISDTYTVTTVKNGVKNVAIALLDAGIPKPIYVSETPTDESNGTVISIPVSNEETMHRLRDEAATLFHRWTTKPLITLGSNGDFRQNKFYYRTFNEYLYLSSHWTYKNTVNIPDSFGSVTLGMFEYSIPLALKNRMEQRYKSSLEDMLKSIQCLSIEDKITLNFNLPIGSLDLSPSRESLEDTLHNAEVLYSYTQKAVNDLLKTVKNNLIPVISAIQDTFTVLPKDYPSFRKLVENFYQTFSKELVQAVSAYLHHTEHKNLPVEAIQLLENLRSNNTIYFSFSYHDGCYRYLDHFTNEDIFLRRKLGIYLLQVYVVKFTNSLSKKVVQKQINLPWASFKNFSRIYLFKGTATPIAKWCNTYNKQEIEIEGELVPVTDIICTNNNNHWEKLIEVLGEQAYIINPELVFVPKQTRVNQTNTSKTKADETLVFSTLYDNTGNTTCKTKIAAGTWYNMPFPENTHFIILKYSTQEYHYSWDEVFQGHTINFPLVVLTELRQGEITTKRFEKFHQTYKHIYINDRDIHPQHSNFEWLYERIYKPYAHYLIKLLVAAELLSFNGINQVDMTHWTFNKIYRYLMKKTPLKHFRLLLTQEEIKTIVGLASKHYPYDNVYGILHNLRYRVCNKHGFLFNLSLEKLAKWAQIPVPNLRDALISNVGVHLLKRCCSENEREWIMSHPSIKKELIDAFQKTLYPEN